MVSTVSGQIMPDATLHGAAGGGYPLRVELIPFLHWGLVTMVGIAAVATLWFAGYVVWRLYSD